MTNETTVSIDHPLGPVDLEERVAALPGVTWEKRVKVGRFDIVLQRFTKPLELQFWFASDPLDEAGGSVYFSQSPTPYGFTRIETFGELWAGRWSLRIERVTVTP